MFKSSSLDKSTIIMEWRKNGIQKEEVFHILPPKYFGFNI